MATGKPLPYSLRPATNNDLKNIVQLFNDCEEADSGLRTTTIEDVQQAWTNPNYDVDLSVRVVENEQQQLVGYASFWDLEKPAIDPWLDLRVHPQFRATPATDLLITWGEERAQRCVAEVPTDLRVALFSGTQHHHTAIKTTFDQHGFTEARHYWEMKIDLDTRPPSPSWPEGIQLFQYETKADVLRNLTSIAIAFNDAFQDHFGHVKRPIENTINRWQHHIETDQKRFDPTLWFLAMDGDEIAAICLCVKEDADDPNNGHVDILGVRRPYRRKGLGLALLHHAFQTYYQRGKTAVTLGVDASSLTNATKLYEKAGMHIHRQFDVYEKELRAGKDIRRQE